MKKPQHPLNLVFDIEQQPEKETYDIVENGSATAITEIPGQHQDMKDADDEEHDANLTEIYEKAIETFQNQIEYTQFIDPKYAARTAEVAASYLQIALQSVATKAKIKQDRRKSRQPVIKSETKNTNVVVADRNAVIEMLRNKNK